MTEELTRRVAQRFVFGGVLPPMAIRVAARYLKRVGREFSSPEALKDYLHEHPQADKSKHTVKKHKDEGGSKSEEKDTKAPSKPKGLFSAAEISHLPEKANQPDKDPKKLFKHAKEAHEHQLNWLNHGKGLDKKIGAKVIRGDEKPLKEFLDDLSKQLDKPGPVIVIGPMKSQERSKEKVEADFGGDWSNLGDIVRSSVAVDSFDQLDDVVKKLKASGLKLARKPKDRFEKPTEAGYRDILMNVEYPNGHIGELQLHLKGILKAKDAGHKFYEEVRTIEAKAKKEGRKEMTDEEKKIVDEANRKSQELYSKAWEEATSPKKKEKSAAMATKVALSTVRYYDWNGVPASWTGKKFPIAVTPKGERVVYELEKFFMEATPISEKEFEALKKSPKK